MKPVQRAIVAVSAALVCGASVSGLIPLMWYKPADPVSGPTTDFAEGAVKLVKPASPFDKKNIHVVTLGERLEFECNFYLDDFFEKSIIWAGANILNPTDETMFFEYHVAFFDEQNHLIGCASQGSYGGLEPGQTTQLGSCLIALDRHDSERVKKYQARVYESSREIGARTLSESAGDPVAPD